MTKQQYRNSNEPFVRIYRKLVQLPIAMYRYIVLNTTWQMYISKRRTTFWVDWFLQDADGNWHLYETPNHSPNHRRSRNFWDVWFYDFKVAIIQIRLAEDSRFNISFKKHLCHESEESMGWKPIAVKSIVRVQPQLSPSKKKERNFNLMTSPVLAEQELGVKLCAEH